MEYEQLRAAVEAMLFASGDPLPAGRMAQVLGVSPEDVYTAAEKMAEEYESGGRGVRLVRMEDRLQLCSAPEQALNITRALEQRKPPRLSQAAMEVLAIIAYFQPTTRAYIERMRGVDSSYTVSLLLDRAMIEPCGRLEVPGRPTLFRTTDLFLRTMGISSLHELPPLPDMTNDENIRRLRDAVEAMKTAQSGEGPEPAGE